MFGKVRRVSEYSSISLSYVLRASSIMFGNKFNFVRHQLCVQYCEIE